MVDSRLINRMLDGEVFVRDGAFGQLSFLRAVETDDGPALEKDMAIGEHERARKQLDAVETEMELIHNATKYESVDPERYPESDFEGEEARVTA